MNNAGLWVKFLSYKRFDRNFFCVMPDLSPRGKRFWKPARHLKRRVIGRVDTCDLFYPIVTDHSVFVTLQRKPGWHQKRSTCPNMGNRAPNKAILGVMTSKSVCLPAYLHHRNSCLPTRIHPVQLKKSQKTFYIKLTRKMCNNWHMISFIHCGNEKKWQQVSWC